MRKMIIKDKEVYTIMAAATASFKTVQQTAHTGTYYWTLLIAATDLNQRPLKYSILLITHANEGEHNAWIMKNTKLLVCSSDTMIFMDFEVLLHNQQRTTEPYPEPVISILHPPYHVCSDPFQYIIPLPYRPCHSSSG
jgi:hypothetical protein